MATLSTFQQQEASTQQAAMSPSATDRLVTEIWLSGVRENMALMATVFSKAVLGILLCTLVAALMPHAPTTGFYAAFSAGISMLYLASLSDARGFRDVISLSVPSLFVLAVLLVAGTHPLLVGVTLFTHVFMAFIAGFSRAGGSLHELGLWPVLFGIELTVLVFYVNQLSI